MLIEKNQEQSFPLTTRLLITGGAIGPLLFTIVYLIEGATRPGYDAWHQAANALSLSDLGWMQIINFIVCGLLIFGFALGVRQTLHGGRGATWGPVLIAAVGLGLITAGIFVTDPAQGYPAGTPPGPALQHTFHGAIHWVFGGFVVFSTLPASCFVFARRWASDPQWKGWSIASIVASVLMVAFFVTFAIASARNSPVGGLLERISLSIGLSWMTFFALRLLGKMRSVAS